MESEQRFNDLLNKNRVQIVERLDLERTFLFDYLLSKSVFDKGDCDLINAKPTREGKASKFLDTLETKGPGALDHFVDALQLLNPNLYELVTGEKATTKPSPIINGFSCCGNNSVDLEILGTYAKRVSGDMQNMTIQYERVLKEKDQLQRALRDAEEKFDQEKRQNERLQHKISETEEILKNKVHLKAQQADQQLAHHIKCIHEDSDTKQFIIQLQMRLLAAHDENENMMRHMMQRLEQVDRSSDRERRETFRISQKLISQSEELKNFRANRECKGPLETGCPHVEDLKYEMLKQKEEIKELKNWTEALKMKYDIAMEETNEVLRTREDLTRDCAKLTDKLSQLEIKFNRVTRESEDLKRNCKELEENAATYRKQRDFHEREMKEALIKRDQAVHELEESTRRYKEELDFKERTIRLQTGDERTFEKQCNELRVDLHRLRTQLRETQQKNEELCAQVARLPAGSAQTEAKTDASGQAETDESSFTSPCKTKGNARPFAYVWQDRETNELLDSVKRRVWKKSATTPIPSVGRGRPVLRTSWSMDEQISALVPAIDQLPPKVKQAFSLDRRQPKKVLPYEAISGMYPDHSGFSRTLPESGRYGTTIGPPCVMTPTNSVDEDDALGSGEDECLSEEEKGVEREPNAENSNPQHASEKQEPHRPRCWVVSRQNARRCRRRQSEESQELSD